MKFIPVPQKRRALTLSLVLALIGITAFMLSSIKILPPILLQLVALGCICAGTYISIRYCFTEITYILRTRGGEGAALSAMTLEDIDFCVTKAQGKREAVTECLLSLDKLSRIDEFTDGYVSAVRREHPDVKLFYYTVSMVKAKKYALIFEDGDDVYCIVVEDCDNLIATLSQFIK